MTQLIPALLGSHTITEQNGMLTLNGLSFPESIAGSSNVATKTPLAESAFVRLVIHAILLVATMPVAASFVLSAHLSNPSSLLCKGIWEHLAFLLIAPQPIVTAMTCLRPDMIETVKSLYGNWLLMCRAPNHISTVLNDIVTTQWQIVSGSPAFHCLAAAIKTTQTAAQRVKSVSNADIVIDNRAGIIISTRDKCFLALALTCGPHRDIIAGGIPAFADAFKATPEAFTEAKRGTHPLDEV